MSFTSTIRAVTGCLLVSLIASIAFIVSEKSAAGQTAPTLIPGLIDQVIIRRDERGIPYIQAKNDHDLYLAQGYVTASDRLWQMDLLRRSERGELAEILSAGPNNVVLDQDKQHRTLGFAQVAEAEFAGASAQSRALLQAYADGVNAYIASLDTKSLPPEFQILQYKPSPWTPADSLLVIKVFAEALSSTWRLDVMREALASLPADKRAMLMPEFSALDVLVVGKDTRKPATSFSKSPTKTFLVTQAALFALAKDQEL
ncbi:MAG TPA: penicillin acylase family protein, partial [Pyrinomonadaceae bacterium]|nr:penicillin acylase family protein [Pyrinomonadaceae bacterium]